MWDERTLAYLAGYIDGEGCFYIGPNHKVCLTISNTHKPTIDWLKETFNGNLYNSGRKRKEHHRPVYTWSAVSNDAMKIIEAVLPYLREKTEQALVLMAIAQTRHWPKEGTRLSADTKAERERLAKIFKGLKHVSY